MAGISKTPLSALEKSYRMLEEVQSSSDRKINIVINGVKDQSAGWIRLFPTQRQAARA